MRVKVTQYLVANDNKKACINQTEVHYKLNLLNINFKNYLSNFCMSNLLYLNILCVSVSVSLL